MILLEALRSVTALGLEPIGGNELALLTAGSKIIERDHKGIKVIELRDGSFLKMFRRKGPFSSAWFFPYAMRFRRNAIRLHRQGIDCPRLIAVYRETSLDIVHYWPVPGQTIRELMGCAPRPDVMSKAGAYIARLHEQGIYFRALHFGNVVLKPNGELALIDIADVRFHRAPLRRGLRVRNFRNILRYNEDRYLLSEGVSAALFWASYSRCASLGMSLEECLV